MAAGDRGRWATAQRGDLSLRQPLDGAARGRSPAPTPLEHDERVMVDEPLGFLGRH